MHVVKGVFCKTAKPGIIAKFAEPQKIDTGPDLLAQQQEKKGWGARGVLTTGQAQSMRRGASKGGTGPTGSGKPTGGRSQPQRGQRVRAGEAE